MKLIYATSFFIGFFNGYSIIYDNFGGIRDPLKQDMAHEFCKNEKKVITILTETHINYDQIYHIRNNWLDPIFFSTGDSHTKGLLLLHHVGLEGITEADNGRVLCVYAPLRYSIREQLARGRFFDGLQS